MTIDFDQALAIVQKAREIADGRSLQASVAVLDAAGHPILVARGKPEAWHGTYMAVGKARLAAAFRKSTAKLMDQWSDRPLFPMSLTEVIPGGVTLNKGGCPLFRDGRCIGALGVGGSSPDNDQTIADETARAMGLAGGTPD